MYPRVGSPAQFTGQHQQRLGMRRHARVCKRPGVWPQSQPYSSGHHQRAPPSRMHKHVHAEGSQPQQQCRSSGLHRSPPPHGSEARVHTRMHTGDMGAYGSIWVHAHTDAYGSMAHTGCVREHGTHGVHTGGRSYQQSCKGGRQQQAPPGRLAASMRARARGGEPRRLQPCHASNPPAVGA